MAYGGALQSHFKGHIYKTEEEMNENYHNDILADWTSWEILSWDCKGKKLNFCFTVAMNDKTL